MIQQDLPINPLYRLQNPTENGQVAYEIANLVRCFAMQLGAKQERNISDCYQRLSVPDFPSLAMELENSGATVDQFLEWFPGVTREQALAALKFAESSLTVVA